MVIKICVEVKAEGKLCKTTCPFFTLETGASTEKPVIETCSLFKERLEESRGRIVRCYRCMKQAIDFNESNRVYAMEKKCHGKPAALKLLKDTGYKIDIFEYQHPKDLFEVLFSLDMVSMRYLSRLLKMDEDDIQKLMDGVEYPYLLKQLQMAIGVPKPPPPDAYSAKFGDAMLMRSNR